MGQRSLMPGQCPGLPVWNAVCNKNIPDSSYLIIADNKTPSLLSPIIRPHLIIADDKTTALLSPMIILQLIVADDKDS